MTSVAANPVPSGPPVPDVAALLAQLPEDLRDGHPPESSLSELIASSGNPHSRAVPLGRFSRFWTLGTLQGKIAAAYAFWWIRGMTQHADERQRRLNETHLKSALQLLGTMSHLRGAVMKLGQVLAAWPGAAPDEFADLLGRLHFQAPPMHFSLLREMVRSELGADPETLFAEFEPDAIAAASLGQVHRARLKTGETVAIKIQYPGIARAIRDDIANMRALITPMRLGQDYSNLVGAIEDIERMLALETDYVAEAANLRTARETLSNMPEVFVPRVHDLFSTPRVLTMDWVPGLHLGHYLATNPTQAERDRFGALITRSGMRMCYRAHMLYCDLHAGNYLFMPDGRLGLIDFGCVRRYTPEDVAYLTEAEAAPFGSREAVRTALIKGADLTPAQQADPERMRVLEALFDWICEPVVHNGVFDFSDPTYIRRGMDLWAESMRRRYTRVTPLNMWINKSFMGLRALLHKLGARVPLGPILREETSTPLPPPVAVPG